MVPINGWIWFIVYDYEETGTTSLPKVRSNEGKHKMAQIQDHKHDGQDHKHSSLQVSAGASALLCSADLTLLHVFHTSPTLPEFVTALPSGRYRHWLASSVGGTLLSPSHSAWHAHKKVYPFWASTAHRAASL